MTLQLLLLLLLRANDAPTVQAPAIKGRSPLHVAARNVSLGPVQLLLTERSRALQQRTTEGLLLPPACCRDASIGPSDRESPLDVIYFRKPRQPIPPRRRQWRRSEGASTSETVHGMHYRIANPNCK
jgi:hypothetical protein